jgi:redox-sensitive bicupin YhaK (pirin superfamily)
LYQQVLKAMNTILHKADSRGIFDHGWLDTRHTFSFAKYYNPDRNNFGALRVLNDDIVKAGKGFGRHPHDNMEIISIPLSGKLLHRDSMGHEQILKTGEVQVMSAGTGIFHEEYNGSASDPVNFLQIWIIPNKHNITPSYNQKTFDADQALNTWQKLVSPNNDGTLTIQQDAIISRVFLSEGENIKYKMIGKNKGCYIFIIDGNIQIEEHTLEKRDGIGITNADEINIAANSDAYILNIEIPL